MKKRTLKDDFIDSINQLKERPGGDILSPLIDSLENDDPAVAIRLNRLKTNNAPSSLRKIQWVEGGFFIDGERPRFTFDPALHQGLYYVQDPSSMIIKSIVKHLCDNMANLCRPLIYIDACAAPGGKTTAAIDALPPGSLVIANEFDRRRAEILCENVTKWGYPNVVITQGDTAKFSKLTEFADIVATDVPCSGEGMMRKDDTAIEQWSPQLVEQCADLQRSIIDNMWKALRPGGFFIYSTCTFNHYEDEDNLAYIIEELGGTPCDMSAISNLHPPIAGSIDSPYPAMRFIPGRIEGEGLFIAVVQKPGEAQSFANHISAKGKSKGQQNRKTSDFTATAAKWINASDFDITTDGDKISALPTQWRSLIDDMRWKLNVLQAGIEIATIKGRDIIPSQALALSTIASPDFPRAEIDYPTAINFLSRQAVTLPDGTPKGFVMLTYRQSPLGFVKNLGNRANNLYPQAWAIRSSHIPDQPPHIY